MSQLPSVNPGAGKPSTEILELATAESLAHVAWCSEYIAEHCWVAQLPPKPWAGRDEVVHAASQHFGIIDLAVIGNAVDQAVLSLWNRQKEDPRNFLKQTLKLRLQGIRQMILRAIKFGRKEEFFKYVPLGDLPKDQKPANVPPNAEPGMLVEIKLKEKRYTGTDMSAVQTLLKIEQMLIEIDNLAGDNAVESVNVVRDFLEGLEDLAKKRAAGEEDSSSAGMSMAAMAKNRKLNNLKPDEKRVLGGILSEQEPQPQKVNVVRAPRGVPVRDRDDSADDSGDNEASDGTDAANNSEVP